MDALLMIQRRWHKTNGLLNIKHPEYLLTPNV